MRDNGVIVSRLGLAALVFSAVVVSACAQDSQNTSSGDANGGRTKGAGERSNTARQVSIGVITDRGRSSCPSPERPCSRILVEEDPDADCGGDGGSLGSGCEKMYFDVTGETAVFRREGGHQKSGINRRPSQRTQGQRRLHGLRRGGVVSFADGGPHGNDPEVPLTSRARHKKGPPDRRTARSDPTGIRTRVFAVRGRCPWPLDDGAVLRSRQSLSEEQPYVKANRQTAAQVPGA